jgi:diguanylate cyclase (GGDEF)-like protein
VILPETKGEDAINVAERIRKGFETEILSPRQNKAVHNTVSIGVSQYETKEELEAFIKRADKAMYMAKEQGKNRVHLMELT